MLVFRFSSALIRSTKKLHPCARLVRCDNGLAHQGASCQLDAVIDGLPDTGLLITD